MFRPIFHIIVAWNKLAEIAGEYLTKGKLVYLEGSILSGKWEDRERNERKSYDIVARYMRMLSPSANGNGATSRESKSTEGSEPSEDESLFDQHQEGEIPF